MRARTATSRRGLARGRLHGVRLPAARRATREARRAIDEAMKVTRRQLRASCRAVCDRARCRRATRSSAATGRRRRSSSRAAAEVSRSSRRSRISRARSARRAAATSPRREQEAEQLGELHKALEDAKNTYWATEVEIQRLAAAAWIALARRASRDEALKLMRAAADLEDKNEKHIVTPGRILPARELLGDMLLEMKQPAPRAQGVRGVAAARAEPLPRLLRGGAAPPSRRATPRRRNATTRSWSRLPARVTSAPSSRPRGNISPRSS